MKNVIDMSDFTPLITGAIGAIVTFLITGVLQSLFPPTITNDSLEKIKAEYGAKVQFANFLSVLGFLIGFSFYFLGLTTRNDWRPFGLGLGLTSLFPLVYLFTYDKRINFQKGLKALEAFAKIQKTPLILIHTFFLFSILLGLFAAIAFIYK